MTFVSFGEHFWMIFRRLDPVGHHNESKSDPKVALSKPGRALGVHNDLILETKNHIKSIKS